MRSLVDAATRAAGLLAVLGLLLLAPGPALLSPAAAAEPFTLAGTVSGPAGEALAGVHVAVVPTGGGSPVASATTATVDDVEGFYRVAVQPGSYWVRFEKAGYAAAYLENDADEDPATVTVGAAGGVTSPGVELDADGWLPDVALLLPPPTVKQAPRLTGEAVVGQTLTLGPGTWSGITVDADYLTVEWFLDGEPADDHGGGAWGETFDVPLEAVGRKVAYRLTVEDPDGERAAAVAEGASAVVPKAASSVAATVRKHRLSVVVTVPGVPRPTGRVTVTDGKRTVGRARLVERRKGRAVIKLASLRPGERRLTVSYAGPSTVSASRSVVKVSVPRR